MYCFILQVLLVTLQCSTMGQVEMNLGAKDLNSTLDNSDNSTNYVEKETAMGFWTENTNCTPGKRPDSGSYTRYFLCVEVLPRVFREYYAYCPPNLVYNSDTSECVSPYFYQRAVRILKKPFPKPTKPFPFYPPIFPPLLWLPRPKPSLLAWTPTTTTPNPQLPSPCKFPLLNRYNVSFCRGICPRVYYSKWNCEHFCLTYVPFR